MASRALLITGATGKQGGSVINALLKANAPFEILALTRNAQSASAQNLLKKSPNIKLITGDFSAVDDIFVKAKEAASAPIWGVFSVQVSHIVPHNNTTNATQVVGKHEQAEGTRLIDAALANNISHFVYSSVNRGVNSDTDPTPVPHFITKFNIEQHLFTQAKNSNMTWTVLRPVAFFENLTPDFFGKVLMSTIKLRLGEATKKLQFIATSDIGFFGAQAFMRAESKEFKNTKIGLAGDELNFSEMKSIFEKKTGEKMPETYAFVARTINWMSEELGYMFKWFRDVGYAVDVEEVRRRHPKLKDFGKWVDTESKWMKQ